MGEGADLPGHLRLVGRHAAPGSGHLGSGLLLGVHEGQPAASELHIEARHLPPPDPTGQRKDGFETKQNIQYIFNPTPHEEEVLLLLSFPF